jgi:hypothetical protein
MNKPKKGLKELLEEALNEPSPPLKVRDYTFGMYKEYLPIAIEMWTNNASQKKKEKL